MADGQDRNLLEKVGEKIRTSLKPKAETPVRGFDVNFQNYISVAKKEVWFIRYLIAIFLLTFLCYELHVVITACMSAAGCKDGITTQTIIEGLRSGIFWVFVVIIIGKGIVPIINAFISFKFGGSSSGVSQEKEKKSVEFADGEKVKSESETTKVSQ